MLEWTSCLPHTCSKFSLRDREPSSRRRLKHRSSENTRLLGKDNASKRSGGNRADFRYREKGALWIYDAFEFNTVINGNSDFDPSMGERYRPSGTD